MLFFCRSIIEKIKMTMRFPKSPKLENLVANSQKSPRRRTEKDRVKLPKLKGINVN